MNAVSLEADSIFCLNRLLRDRQARRVFDTAVKVPNETRNVPGILKCVDQRSRPSHGHIRWFEFEPPRGFRWRSLEAVELHECKQHMGIGSTKRSAEGGATKGKLSGRPEVPVPQRGGHFTTLRHEVWSHCARASMQMVVQETFRLHPGQGHLKLTLHVLLCTTSPDTNSTDFRRYVSWPTC